MRIERCDKALSIWVSTVEKIKIKDASENIPGAATYLKDYELSMLF